MEASLPTKILFPLILVSTPGELQIERTEIRLNEVWYPICYVSHHRNKSLKEATKSRVLHAVLERGQ